jgi:hypothetical protein
MTAAAGTVVSCTVFLPAVNANQALQASDTDRPAPHASSLLLACGLLCCLPALKHTLSSTVHPVCQSHLVSSMQRVQHLCAVLQALLHAVSLCTPCLVYAGVHAVQVQSVTRFLSEHMFPMRSASEDSEPAYHCSHLWTACHAVCIWLQ